MTSVTSVRRRKIEELSAIPEFLYVGRAVPRSGWGQTSRWSNPWRVADFSSPEACLVHYTAMVARVVSGDSRNPTNEFVRRAYDWELFVHGIQTAHLLRGRVLGCWCGEWQPGQPDIPCHAVVLAKLAESSFHG